MEPVFDKGMRNSDSYEKPEILVYNEKLITTAVCNSMSTYEACHCTSSGARVSY